MKTCQFHDPKNNGEVCGSPAEYGVTYTFGKSSGRISFMVCEPHWNEYLAHMKRFIKDNEKGWRMYLKAER